MRKRGKFLNIILIAVVVLVVLFVIASIVIINHYMKQYFNRSEQKNTLSICAGQILRISSARW